MRSLAHPVYDNYKPNIRRGAAQRWKSDQSSAVGSRRLKDTIISKEEVNAGRRNSNLSSSQARAVKEMVLRWG